MLQNLPTACKEPEQDRFVFHHSVTCPSIQSMSSSLSIMAWGCIMFKPLFFFIKKHLCYIYIYIFFFHTTWCWQVPKALHHNHPFSRGEQWSKSLNLWSLNIFITQKHLLEQHLEVIELYHFSFNHCSLAFVGLHGASPFQLLARRATRGLPESLSSKILDSTEHLVPFGDHQTFGPKGESSIFYRSIKKPSHSFFL